MDPNPLHQKPSTTDDHADHGKDAADDSAAGKAERGDLASGTGWRSRRATASTRRWSRRLWGVGLGSGDLVLNTRGVSLSSRLGVRVGVEEDAVNDVDNTVLDDNVGLDDPGGGVCAADVGTSGV